MTDPEDSRHNLTEHDWCAPSTIPCRDCRMDICGCPPWPPKHAPKCVEENRADCVGGCWLEDEE